jgi:hypothetical protein
MWLALLDGVEDLPSGSRARLSATDGLGVRDIGAFMRKALAESRVAIAVALGSSGTEFIAR